jgi:hypothetical protein
VLNVFPTSATETVVVFSYGSEDVKLAQAALDRVLTTDGEYQKYELSKLVIDRVENFALSPAHYNSWPAAKKAKIRDAFVSTVVEASTVGAMIGAVTTNEPVGDDTDLMLF